MAFTVEGAGSEIQAPSPRSLQGDHARRRKSERAEYVAARQIRGSAIIDARDALNLVVYIIDAFDLADLFDCAIEVVTLANGTA